MMQRTCVALFTSRSARYVQEFEEARFLEVLEFKTVAGIGEVLRRRLGRETEVNVFVTSPRAAEIVRKEVGEQIGDNVKFYLPGEATRNILEDIDGVEIKGSQSGSAKALAEYFLAHGNKDAKNIFLCQAAHRMELPHVLQQAGIELEKIIIYESVTILSEETKSFFASADSAGASLCFFSPVGAEFILKFLVQEFRDKVGLFKYVAIGNTTGRAIESFFERSLPGFSVKVTVAKSPTPVSLRAAVMES